LVLDAVQQLLVAIEAFDQHIEEVIVILCGLQRNMDFFKD
jgi:hypothetical protein